MKFHIHLFGFLQGGDNAEQIGRAWIAFWAEHALQAR